MSDSTGGAGPALAAHSKDASASQTQASEVTAQRASHASGEEGETIFRIANDIGERVRQQPIAAMTVCVVIGVLLGKTLR